MVMNSSNPGNVEAEGSDLEWWQSEETARAQMELCTSTSSVWQGPEYPPHMSAEAIALGEHLLRPLPTAGIIGG
jgi:hypothetical protein